LSLPQKTVRSEYLAEVKTAWTLTGDASVTTEAMALTRYAAVSFDNESRGWDCYHTTRSPSPDSSASLRAIWGIESVKVEVRTRAKS